MSAPRRLLRITGGRELELGGAPWLMGIVNASPESFSDGSQIGGLEQQVVRARELVAAGARIIDVGGESGVTSVPAVGPEEEIRRVVLLIERLAGEEGMLVSVDTFEPAVAAAAVEAGAAIVNDVSGLRDERLAEVCARTGAGLVVMHTRAEPKTKVLDHPYEDVLADVLDFLGERIDAATARGVDPAQIVVDPGPDFAKSPAQTIEVLRGLASLHELDRPLLLAVSRKDFVGALTGRGPRERAAGTLAALAHGVDHGAHIARVHDVEAAADFIAVRRALREEDQVAPDLALAEDLRRAT
jgi:dihydropteroate synthase